EIFMHAYKLHVTVRSLRLPGFYFYPERFPELPHGFGEGFIFNFHIELEDVAAFFTPETVADLLIRADRERWRLFIMERTETDIAPAAFFQLYITGNQFSNVGPTFHFFYCLFRDPQVSSSLNIYSAVNIFHDFIRRLLDCHLGYIDYKIGRASCRERVSVARVAVDYNDQ